MNKQLDNYRTNPTLINALKVREYFRKHPMSKCVLSKEDNDLLTKAVEHTDRGPKIIFTHIK